MSGTDFIPAWMCWVLAGCMWAAGISKGYIGWNRVGHPGGGLFLALVRVISLGWILYASRLTFVLFEKGALPLTWWAAGPLVLLSNRCCWHVD
jgi:hypothetical protein